MRVFGVALLLASMTAALAAPNIVVIMTDDQENTGSMAYMPKLQALLAEQGVTFKNSFVDLPLCAPSRASFFTGQASHNTGIKANSPLDKGGWEAFKDKEPNALPVWLGRQTGRQFRDLSRRAAVPGIGQRSRRGRRRRFAKRRKNWTTR